MKPYRLGNIQDLLSFDRDCYEAACNCPQFNSRHNASEIKNKTMTPRDVYHNWKICDTLMVSGYHIMLTPRAIKTFNYIYEHGLKELCQSK